MNLPQYLISVTGSEPGLAQTAWDALDTPSALYLKQREITHEQKNYQLGTLSANSYFLFTSSALPRIVLLILS